MRVHIGPLHGAVPILILLAIIAMGALVMTFTAAKLFIAKTYLPLLRLTLLFILAHILSNLYWGKLADGAKDILKLCIGITCFWSTVAFLPRDERFRKTFLLITFWSTTVFFIFTLHQSVYKYNLNFLSPYIFDQLAYKYNLAFLTDVNYDPTVRGGKNPLAWYLAVVIPFALTYFMNSKHKFVLAIPLISMLACLIFSQSRSGWIGVVLGFAYVVLDKLRRQAREGIKILFMMTCATAIAIGILYRSGNSSELYWRAVSVINPESMPEEMTLLGKHSYENRSVRIKIAFEEGLKSPILGLGAEKGWGWVHNDFAAIFMHYGAIGLLLFLGIIISIWRHLRPPPAAINQGVGWDDAGKGALLSILVFCGTMDGYTSPQLWFILGLALAFVNFENNIVFFRYVPQISKWKELPHPQT